MIPKMNRSLTRAFKYFLQDESLHPAFHFLKKKSEFYDITIKNFYKLAEQNIEITKLVIELMNKDEDYIEYVEDRPGHDRRYSLNCSKIKNELGWAPKYDFYEFMRKTVEWYKENKWWWEKLKQ